MTFTAKHLLGIENLSRDDIVSILDLAEQYVALNRQSHKRWQTVGRGCDEHGHGGEFDQKGRDAD